MNFNCTLAFFAVSFALISCNDTAIKKSDKRSEVISITGQDTIHTVTYYQKNGQRESVLRYRGKTLHGISETYFPDGKLKQTKTFYQDKDFGSYIEYYENGTISRYSFLVDSVHNSYERVYDVNGKLLKILGDPLTCWKLDHTAGSDSANIKLYLSDFDAKKVEVFWADMKRPGDLKQLEIGEDNILKSEKISLIKLAWEADSSYSYLIRMRLTNLSDSLEYYTDQVTFRTR